MAELIREKALRCLEEEVPHGVAVTVERMKFRKSAKHAKIADIEANIICERESHKGFVHEKFRLQSERFRIGKTKKANPNIIKQRENRRCASGIWIGI